MTDWFARPVLHVTNVEASLRFYVNRLGFTSPWRYDEDGRARVPQVDRQGCALILADTWPEKIGKGMMFISLNVEPETREAAVVALDALRAELEAIDVIPAQSEQVATLSGRLHPNPIGMNVLNLPNRVFCQLHTAMDSRCADGTQISISLKTAIFGISWHSLPFVWAIANQTVQRR